MSYDINSLLKQLGLQAGLGSQLESQRLSPEAVQMYAERLRTTGKMPSLNRGPSGQSERQRIMEAMGVPKEAANMPTSMIDKYMTSYMPTTETSRNYADDQMPLYTGGLLRNQQGDMVDPQELLNVAYDMNAPREMRNNAIERLRALGIK